MSQHLPQGQYSGYLSNGWSHHQTSFSQLQNMIRVGQAQQPLYARAAPPQPRVKQPKQGLKVRKQVLVEDDDDEEADIGDGMEENHYANVVTDELQALGLYKHPSPVSEAASLSSIRLPEVDYAVKLPGHVISSKILSISAA